MKTTKPEKELEKIIKEIEGSINDINQNFILIQKLKNKIKKIELILTIFTSFYFPFQIMLWSLNDSKTITIISSFLFFIIFIVAFITLKNKIYLIEYFIDLLMLKKEFKKEDFKNEI